MKKISEAEMLHKMAAYCSNSEHCIYDVEKKMENSELSPEAKKRITDRLVQEKYINEERFANSFANDKLRFNKWGRIRILMELRKKNIPDTIRKEAIENLDEKVYQEVLLSILKNKKKSVKGKDERDTYYKLLRFAAGRGFESGEINACLKQLLNESYDEEYPE